MALSPDQIKVRLTGVTASEVAVILGVAPASWDTCELDLWSQKVGLELPKNIDTVDTRRGIRYQRPAIDDAAEREEWEVVHEGDSPLVDLGTRGTIRHPRHELILATPDFLVTNGEPGCGECKCPRSGATWGPPGTHLIPAYYLPQVTIQASVLDLDRIEVVGWWYGEPHVYHLRRNCHLEAAIISRLEEWWELYVIPQRPPPVRDGRDATAKWLDRHYHKHTTNSMRGATSDEIELASRLAEIAEIESPLKAEADRIKNQLKSRIGAAEGIVIDFGKITWRKAKDREVLDAVEAEKWIRDHNGGELPLGLTKVVPGGRRFLSSFKKEM